MSREIRKVPRNWDHPKNNYGNKMRYKPLHDGYEKYAKNYLETLQRYVEGVQGILAGKKVERYNETFDTLTDWYEFYGEGELVPPDKADFMPTGEWLQLYETVSEGTPLSPPFETKEELVDWLTNNEDYCGDKRSKEAAEYMVEKGYCPSGIMVGGKYYRPSEQHMIDPKNK